MGFLHRGLGHGVFLTSTGAVLEMMPRHEGARRALLKLQFENAEPSPEMRGESELMSTSNYFLGAEAVRHITDVRHYARVRYAQLYPGIDALVYGRSGNLEYDFVIAPGADPQRIAMSLEGADTLSVNAEGDLLIGVGGVQITQRRPFVYQEDDNGRTVIDGRYQVRSGKRVAFVVGGYDRARSLIIDPVLEYSTYISGTADDWGMAVAVDSNGATYVAGYTASPDFPVLNAYDTTLRSGDFDVFVTKLNPAGTALIYSTFIGGRNGKDFAVDLAVDASGNAYLTGTTNDTDYPVTTGAYQTAITGGGSFVTKLGPAGNTLVYSTYVRSAIAREIAVDASGSAYITGNATSAFTTTSGAFQPAIADAATSDAFVLKLNPAGTAASYATFLGGTAADSGRGIAVDGSGSAVIAGNTSSTNFPVSGALQSSTRGLGDGFVAKLNASGTALIFSTYFGGSAEDLINGVALDSAGRIYLTGATRSLDFPTAGGFRSTKSGPAGLYNVFVSKLPALGDTLLYSFYYAGTGCTGSCEYLESGDQGHDIAVDADGHAYVTGVARSSNFPRIGSFGPPPVADGITPRPFLFKVGALGTSVLYSTVMAGDDNVLGASPTGGPINAGNGVAVDTTGNAYAAGHTYSTASLPTTSGAYEVAQKGGWEAFVFKVTTPTYAVTLSSSAPSVDSGQSVSLTASVAYKSSGSGAPTGTVDLYDGTSYVASADLVNGIATTTTTLPIGIHRLVARYASGDGGEGISPLLYQTVEPAACN